MEITNNTNSKPKPFQFHAVKETDAAKDSITTTTDTSFTNAIPKNQLNYHSLVSKWRAAEGKQAKEIINLHHTQTSKDDIQGLQIYARVRPILPTIMNESAEAPAWETMTCASPYLFVHTAEERLGLPTGRLLSTPQRFTQVFAPECQESEIYSSAIEPLINAAIDDQEQILLIAFGQTGSGKTHTISSCMASTLTQLFQKGDTVTKGMTIQYFEIRGTKILDLLSNRAECKLMTDARGDVQVIGVKSITCNTVEEMQEEVNHGVMLRATKATNSNSQSSRSHAMLVIDLPNGGRVRMVVSIQSEESEHREWSEHRVYGKHCRLTFLCLLPLSTH